MREAKDRVAKDSRRRSKLVYSLELYRNRYGIQHGYARDSCLRQSIDRNETQSGNKTMALNYIVSNDYADPVLKVKLLSKKE
jgi:hypothetical protein